MLHPTRSKTPPAINRKSGDSVLHSACRLRNASKGAVLGRSSTAALGLRNPEVRAVEPETRHMDESSAPHLSLSAFWPSVSRVLTISSKLNALDAKLRPHAGYFSYTRTDNGVDTDGAAGQRPRSIA